MDAIFASDGPRPMQCKKCGEAKLHDEFPSDGPSENCNHLPTWCLKCLKDNMTAGLFRIGYNCPECHAMARVSDVDMITHLLDSIICPVFHDLDKIQKMKQEAAVSMVPASGSVEVVLLDGQRCSLELRREMSLAEMKQKIASRLGVPASQQRLMHGGQELKPDTLEWKDAKVSYGSILQVVVVMYETGPGSSMPGGGNVRALNFELTWLAKLKKLKNGKTAIDHLNGSCFVLNDRLDLLASVDFMRRSWGSIMHHGPSNRHSARQKITVSMDSMPGASYLFFTLSAFAQGGITLANFESPKVELRNAQTNTVLADYTASRAMYDEAVILCCAKRDIVSGAWSVQRIGKTSSGNVKHPHEFISTIRHIVESRALL